MMDERATEQTLDDLEPIGAVQPGEVDIKRVCWIAFWANLGLALLKITVGALGRAAFRCQCDNDHKHPLCDTDEHPSDSNGEISLRQGKGPVYRRLADWVFPGCGRCCYSGHLCQNLFSGRKF